MIHASDGIQIDADHLERPELDPYQRVCLAAAIKIMRAQLDKSSDADFAARSKVLCSSSVNRILRDLPRRSLGDFIGLAAMV